ncbi:DUF366 family protein [Methanomethylovorans sp.]|uniref:DUF366 family protein n=1 Tax=Methanomethylovorans sp. TaxID=2758717 RepID=UPI00345E1F99
MKWIVLKRTIDYDGSQISSLWGYMEADLQEDSIIAFRGSCDVQIRHMIDLEDRKEGDSIYSNDMLHFVIEHFDSTDLKLIYTRQRLFASIVAETLLQRGIRTSRAGDDLFVQGKKLSISIASTSAVSQKIHFGMNVEHNVYGCLSDQGVPEKDMFSMMEEIASRYVEEVHDIEKDLRKSRPLSVI